MSAYIPEDRRQALARGESLAGLARGAVLFADISGFTPLTEALVRALGPRRGTEVLPQQLNRVYDALIGEVDGRGGCVIGFSGDAITCWFDGDDGASATACALALQEKMSVFALVPAPGGEAIALALKVAVASGSAKRFLVGDPKVQLIDVIAGATLSRVAAAEGVANKGEVVLDEPTANGLEGGLEVAEWREEGEGRFAVVQGVRFPSGRTTPSPLPSLSEAQLRPWLLPVVYERLRSGQGEFLTELRPAVALFLRFGGIDYDDDGEAGEKLDRFIRWVQEVLSRYEGTLIQLTFGDKGSFLYAAFGAPVAHEDDVQRAAEAALELRLPPPELNFITSVQIGLSTGTMRTGAYGGSTRRTYGVLGDEVNLAARLMAQAAPGQVVVSEHIYKAAVDDFLWQPLGVIRVKGKGEPLSVYELVAAEGQAHGLQESSYTLPMVGREAELAFLGEKIAEVTRGQGRIVGITAEAGMGKSRLVAEALRLARSHELIIYGGVCQSYGANTPYLVWQSIWRALFGLDPEDALAAQANTLEAALRGIDPSLLPRLPLLGPVVNLPLADTELSRSFDPQLRKASLEALLVDCLRARANEPLLFVLEDLHWIDALSHDLLEAVARVIADMPVLVLLAYRPLELGRLQAPRLTALPHFSEIALGEFTPEESERLIKHKLAQEGEGPGDVAAELVAQLSERAQGNPFYIEELLNFLRDSGIDPRHLARWREVALPSSLQSLILSRIDRLAERQKITLKVASVIGRLIRVAWLLEYFPELGAPEDVKGDLEALRRLDLTLLETPEPELNYLFKHIMTREVAYESLAYATRAVLHERLAHFLESHIDPERNLDLLAYHYDKSENLAKKKDYLWRAGEAAQAAYANEAAIDYYERALPLVAGHEGVEVRLKLGEIKVLLGRYQEAEASYRQVLAGAEERADERVQARCRRLMGELREKQGDYAEALTWLEGAQTACQVLGDYRELVQVLVDGSNVYIWQGDYATAKVQLEKALTITEELSDLKSMARVLHGLGIIHLYQGDDAAARKLFEESLAIRRDIGDKLGMTNTLNNLGVIAVNQGEALSAQKLFEESLALRREIGYKSGIAESLNNLGHMASDQGAGLEAQELFEMSLALRRELGDKLGIAITLNNLGNLAHAGGDDVAAARLYRENLAVTREIGNKREAAAALAGMAAVVSGAASKAQQKSVNPERAVRLAAAADALLASIGAAVEAEVKSLRESVLAAGFAHLDETSFAKALEEGKAMTLEQAVAYALESE